jgi:hypothetical protein
VICLPINEIITNANRNLAILCSSSNTIQPHLLDLGHLIRRNLNKPSQPIIVSLPSAPRTLMYPARLRNTQDTPVSMVDISLLVHHLRPRRRTQVILRTHLVREWVLRDT